ncbi:hypothetical protein [Paraburkholderia sediminicola]|uniref:hypothetical protein n=1 Tax=Paraburkholderia sediminicola TaxID=458836 RepID=UPI0038BDE6CF
MPSYRELRGSDRSDVFVSARLRECTSGVFNSQSVREAVSADSRRLARAICQFRLARIDSVPELHRRTDRSPIGMPVAIFIRHTLDNPYSIGPDMKNPWMKKNPFLSMWLSGANAVAGSARGHATAAAKRGTTAFWTAALAPPKPKKKRRTRR